MAENPETLFKKLTRLFKSGPVLKRKIKTIDTAIAVPDKSKSSGTLLFQKSLSPTYATITANAYNLSERLMRYQDFQEMEYTPEIASTMDIYADEAVAQDDKGRVLHIFSDNEKINQILEDLFYNVLNVEFNLRGWVRNLCKYGDFFLYNDVSPEYGVINAFPIPVNEIEREENYDPEDPFAVRFRWVTLGNRTLENWEVSHFRLLGNDMFLPYGSSVIEPARRIWRQLILIEDAMLVYRVVRAPERRVFYIDVANIPSEDISTYMEEQKRELRSSQVVDKETSRVDLRYNPLSVDEDYFIPVRGSDSGTRIDTLAAGSNTGTVEDVAYIQKKLFASLKIPRAYLGYDEMLSCLVSTTCIPTLNGNTLTIKELADECQQDPEVFNGKHYVYSCDPLTGEFKPGKVIKAWKSKDVSILYKITLDNGHVIECTDNHPFLCRDGKYKRADELISGQSLMAQYRRSSVSKKKGGSDLIHDYEMLLDNLTNEWKYTHKLVDKCLGNKTIGKSRVIHHVDCNKYNNNPKNLKEMTWVSHRKWHSQHLESTLLRPDVISIERIQLNEPVPVYDIEIDEWSNFLIVPNINTQWESGVQVHNSKATLAQEDIRFSRSISVIQKTIIAELNKLAIIHLYANGFENEDLVNFTLRLSNPSTVAQQQKLEIWRSKFEIAGSTPEGMLSKTFIYKNIMDLTDDEIDNINKQRLRDKIIDAAIEGEEGGFGGGSAGGLGGGGGDDFGGDEGGGDEDIFGDEGGGDDLGGEEPPEENAGEEPEEEEEIGVDLLTSSDDVDDQEHFKLPSADTNKPVNVSPHLQKTLYNRSRRRTHGASTTHMPDFVKMTSHGGREDTLKDPFDNNWLKSVVSNPLGEANDTSTSPRLGNDTMSMLEKMSGKLGILGSDGILLEGIDVQDEIDSGGILNESHDNDIIDEGVYSTNVDNELDIVEHEDLDDDGSDE